MGRLVFLASGLLLLGVAQAQTPPDGLSFAWPVPSSAEVVETVRVNGKLARFRHRVELSRKGDELRLRFVESKALKVGETELEGGPQLGGELAKIAAFYPEIRIAKDGKPLGTTGTVEAVDRWVRLAQELDPTLDAKAIARTRKQLLAQRDLFENRALNLWQLWAASWIGSPPAPESEASRDESIPIGEARVKARSTVANLGEPKGGGVHLVREIALGGEEARAAFDAFVRKANQDAPRVERFERTTRLEVFTDRRTLRPRLAASRQVTTVGAEGKQTTRTEVRQYTFTWN